MTRPHYLQARGEAWDKARMRALVRDDFTCQYDHLNLTPIEGGCNANNRENRLRFLHVHHIHERINGGTHDLDNLITICRAHHIQLHPHMRFEYAVQDRYLEGGPDKEL